MTAGPDGLEPGPQNPVDDLPPLAPGGARRTTTIDTERPDGPAGPAVITACGRDVVVDADGRIHVRASITLVGHVTTDGTLTSIEPAEPIEPAGPDEAIEATGQDRTGDITAELSSDRLAPLAGQSLRVGMGALVARHLSDDLRARTLLGSLLEDLAGAYFVSGTVLMWADLTAIDRSGLDLVIDMQTDVCAGWQRGASQQVFLVERSALAKPGGPKAPDLAAITGWPGRHPLQPLPPQAHRRARLLDVELAPGHGHRLRAHFRDSVRGDGPERVLHEYRVDAEVDGTDVITSIAVDARVLPWTECPAAATSGERAVGRSLTELPVFARRELVGTATCTHLNATVRSLADATALTTLVGSTS